VKRLGAVTLVLLLGMQVMAALRVVIRLGSTASGSRIPTVGPAHAPAGRVTVIVPVLNEEHRLGPCLAGLMAQPDAVAEILVVDGGSTDRTAEITRRAAEEDARIRWIDASPPPANWNGKAWGLQIGLDNADRASEWILTIDADVRPGPDLVPSLIAHVWDKGLDVCSVATPQRVSGPGEAMLHPSLLASLVYRYGIPGHAVTSPEAVQANGQCFLVRAVILRSLGGFEVGRDSVCEDVTIARHLARAGFAIGFYEPATREQLVSVAMYRGWRDAWRNWTRSLPMRDGWSGWGWWLRMLDMSLLMGVPLPLVLGCRALSRHRHEVRTLIGLAYRLNGALLLMRCGIAAGMKRAYQRVPVSYWLAPGLDPAVVLKLWLSALTRTHSWRGRSVSRR
jgi:dolichol-phosphate mannosyltransferase